MHRGIENGYKVRYILLALPERMLMDVQRLKKRVRGLLIFFIVALLLNGITPFPLEGEKIT
jgi:hypothetical protein